MIRNQLSLRGINEGCGFDRWEPLATGDHEREMAIILAMESDRCGELAPAKEART